MNERWAGRPMTAEEETERSRLQWTGHSTDGAVAEREATRSEIEQLREEVRSLKDQLEIIELTKERDRLKKLLSLKTWEIK